VLVLHDITDLRHADQVRRDFVANVSHELRTPLTAIRGYVEALLDAPPDPDEARRFLDVIARHSLRMERLVRDLLRLARLDAGPRRPRRARPPRAARPPAACAPGAGPGAAGGRAAAGCRRSPAGSRPRPWLPSARRPRWVSSSTAAPPRFSTSRGIPAPVALI